MKGKWGNFIKSIADYIKSEWKMLIPLYHFIEPKLYNQIDNFKEIEVADAVKIMEELLR